MARQRRTFTREQMQSRKDKAVRFTRDVLFDLERADEIDSESLDDYAERRHMQLSNPQRRTHMAKKTVDDYKAEIDDLKSEIQELESENEDLQEQLDKIVDIASGEEDEDEEEEEEEQGDEESGDDEDADQD